MRFARSAIPVCSAEFQKRFNTKVAKIAKITKESENGAPREAHSITFFVILAILATFVLNPGQPRSVTGPWHCPLTMLKPVR